MGLTWPYKENVYWKTLNFKLDEDLLKIAKTYEKREITYIYFKKLGFRQRKRKWGDEKTCRFEAKKVKESGRRERTERNWNLGQ